MRVSDVAAERPSDRVLIERIRAGEHHLFDELVAMEEPLLRICAARLLPNSTDVDDVVQETLWKAFSRLDQFRGESSFRTWLCSIVFNESRMRARRGRREVALDTNDTWRRKAVDHVSALDQLVQRETEARVADAVARLPARYRTVIRLRFAEGESVADTARMLAATISATKTWQHRACQLLRQRLSAG